MIQKFKSYIIVLLSSLMFAVPMLAPAAVYAACSHIGDQVSSGATGAANNGQTSSALCADTNVGTGSITTLAAKVVNYFSIIVGAVAVIMIIYGGFRYITSGGESGRVGNAKNTLIYAIIGLVIVALAQLIVHFVLNTSSNAVSGQ